MATTQAAERWELPKGMRKEFLAFMKTIATFKGDLSTFTAPPFILSTTSLSEYPLYWAEQPIRFTAPAHESDPAKRALAVLTWFLSTLKQQYDHRPDRKKGKPLNPVLGELFLGTIKDDRHGDTEVVSEQVCHHPPVTAYKLWNDDAGVSLEGYHAAKTFFANRVVNLHKVGHVMYRVERYDESYLITFPQAHLEGFLPPPPFPEFGAEQPVYIVGNNGYMSKIAFSGKGWLRGKRNTFEARLFQEGREEDTLFSASGQWTGTFTVRDANDEVLETYDAASSMEKLTRVSVRPLDEQDPMESRRLWGKFAEAMRRKDMTGLSAEKNRIEVEQRELRKEEEKEGRDWARKYFERAEVDSRVEMLAEKIGLKIEPELTGGYWRYDEKRYAGAEKTRDDPFGDDKAVV